MKKARRRLSPDEVRALTGVELFAEYERVFGEFPPLFQMDQPDVEAVLRAALLAVRPVKSLPLVDDLLY